MDQAALYVTMNKDLADILLNNLIKNAVIHTADYGYVKIIIEEHALIIENPGDHALDTQHIFKRFYKHGTSKNTTGLGLAIVKTIADRYGFELTYSYSGVHRFRIHF